MKLPVDTGFINDLSQLDSLRKQATTGTSGDQQKALKGAANQFESIFTQMLFKSMRDANQAFKSDLIDNRTTQFYQQMADEQMSSALSNQGALGLADLIVSQLKGAQGEKNSIKSAESEASLNLPKSAIQPSTAPEEKENLSQPSQVGDPSKDISPLGTQASAQGEKIANVAQKPFEFKTPSDFVRGLMPLAQSAAKALKVNPMLLLAQAALETGWGKKVIANPQGTSHNLFNIKADKSWNGDKIGKPTIEYQDGIAKKQRAEFRAYPSFQDSFDDFAKFLKENPRYRNALSQTQQPEQFMRAIHQSGYATDPRYADKVLRVFQQIQSIGQ